MFIQFSSKIDLEIISKNPKIIETIKLLFLHITTFWIYWILMSGVFCHLQFANFFNLQLFTVDWTFSSYIHTFVMYDYLCKFRGNSFTIY